MPKLSVASSGENAGGSSAFAVYNAVREGLIWGRWEPGEKLKPQHLKASFKCTSSVLREALIRLAGEGFVKFEEQRGFSTILPTRESFFEVRAMRVLLECEGARLSIERGGIDWEINLKAAHHRLAHLEERMRSEEDLRGFIKIWSLNDWEFHQALIAACGSSLLREMHSSVYDKFRLHVVAELKNFGFRAGTTIGEHEAIVGSALERDAKGCARAIEDHLAIYRTRSHEQ